MLPSFKNTLPNSDKFPLIINTCKQQSSLSHESRQPTHPPPPSSVTSLHGVKKLLVIKSSTTKIS